MASTSSLSEAESENQDVRGRPKMDDIWYHIRRYLLQDSKWKQVCRYCGKKKASSQLQTTDWAVHLVSKCKKAPIEVKRAIASKSTSQVVKRNATDAGVTGVDIDLTATEEQPEKKQRTLNAFSDHCDKARADRISLSIMKGCLPD
jgi:hypothetical protein